MTESAHRFDVEIWTNRQHFAALSLDGLNLLLPQEDVRSVEPVLDVEPTTSQRTAGNWVDQEQKHWSVYCLTADLTPMGDLPVERRVCVILDHEAVRFGLSVEQVITLQQAQLSFFSLPHCMRLPGSPIRALACQNDTVLCVTTATDLADYLAQDEYLSTPALEGRASDGIGRDKVSTRPSEELGEYG